MDLLCPDGSIRICADADIFADRRALAAVLTGPSHHGFQVTREIQMPHGGRGDFRSNRLFPSRIHRREVAGSKPAVPTTIGSVVESMRGSSATRSA